MPSIQEICAESGRQLQAARPTEVAGQPVEWQDVHPWHQIESPDPSAMIFVAHELHDGGWAPNLVGTVAAITPSMAADEALHAIAGTATSLDNWHGMDDVAGEGDEEAGARQSTYRYIHGTYDAEPGRMATSSLLAAWNQDDSTFVFQLTVTTFQVHIATHEQALQCARIGEWTAGEIVAALRG